ncbi:MAG TPA: hypothetical protein VFU76_12715 [Terriglobales bacterium]|nr:hypothetical protein [Terriglobales bacterium]
MPTHDADERKGAVEQDRRNQDTNTSLSGQLPHRTDNRLVKASDSDFPEPGNNEEHTGEPEAQLNDQNPGQRQKENQNKSKDDPLAA